MTDTWPDPARPGVPLNPKQDGWHWLQEGDQQKECCFWRSRPWLCRDQGLWELTGCEDEFFTHDVKNWRYHGPCFKEAEVQALVAETRRAALEEAMVAAHDAWQDGVPPAEIAAAISKLLMEKKDD